MELRPSLPKWLQTVIAASSTLLLVLPAGVLSFGTIELERVMHQHSEHEHITRAALACSSEPGVVNEKDCFEFESMNQLAGSPGDYGAVGAPDILLPEGLVFEDGAHCDNADFLDFEFSPDYPQTREKATEALEKCVEHMKDEITGGVRSAKALLTSKGFISSYETAITSVDCVFRYTSDILNSFVGRAKCNTLQGFGYALHGVQDFYAHSNYGDSRNDGEAISITNPPGLGNTKVARLLDLRTYTGLPLSKFVSRWLTTGCFNVVELLRGETGSLGCSDRITHFTVNKDEGDITDRGKTSNPRTPRGQKGNNFDMAVQLAIEDTKRQWKDFQLRLRDEHGARKANLMVCALIKDDPKNSCQGRYLAIAVDSSGSNSLTDPSNLRIAAAKSFNSILISKNDVDADGLPDQVTVIDFDDSASVIYPLGDPSGAAFDSIDSSGGTSIASGLSASIGELTGKTTGPIANRSGILVLTDGEDPDLAGVEAQMEKAESLGIRVSWGFLSPATSSTPGLFRRTENRWLNGDILPRSQNLAKRAPSISLLELILRTGGTYSTIDSAEAQKNFVDLVISNGPTDIDNAGDAGTGILPGLTIAKLISAAKGEVRLLYRAVDGERMNFTVTALNGQVLNATLHDIRSLEDLESQTTDVTGKVVITFKAVGVMELELLVSTDAAEEGVFTVGLVSSIPIRNETNTTTSSHAPISTARKVDNVTVLTTKYITTCPITLTTIESGRTTTLTTHTLSTVTTTVCHGCRPSLISVGSALDTQKYGDGTTLRASVGTVFQTQPYGPGIVNTPTVHPISETSKLPLTEPTSHRVIANSTATTSARNQTSTVAHFTGGAAPVGNMPLDFVVLVLFSALQVLRLI